MSPRTRPGASVPPCSIGTASSMSSPRSSAAVPRVIGAMTSDSRLNGWIIISMQVMKATKSPTVLRSWPLSRSAIMITAASANDASTCVTGVISEPAADCLIVRLRIRRALSSKRRVSWRAAPCSRTMRHASTFSSTT